MTSRTLVMPWTRSTLPGAKHIVITAWDRTQRCTAVPAAHCSPSRRCGDQRLRINAVSAAEPAGGHR
jgi:hypothetical protein